MRIIKYLISFALCITISNIHATRLSDLEDTLDEIQINLLQQQIFESIDRQERERILRNEQKKIKNRENDYISPHSFINKNDKIFPRKLGEIAVIRKSSIKKINDNLVMFTSIIEWDNPQYTDDNKTYYGILSLQIFGCKGKTDTMIGNILYNSNLEIVASYEWPMHYNPIPAKILNGDTQIAQEFRYICSGFSN